MRKPKTLAINAQNTKANLFCDFLSLSKTEITNAVYEWPSDNVDYDDVYDFYDSDLEGYYQTQKFWNCFFGKGNERELDLFDNEEVIYGNRASKKREEENATHDDLRTEKIIYFYRDYNNPDDKECFKNLYEFDEFCNNEGIDIPEDVVQDLVFKDQCHCAINPQKRLEEAKLELLCESNFGTLKWICASYEDNVEIN